MATTIQITPERVIFAAGKFDSDLLYIRSSPSIGEFRMPLNFTMQLEAQHAPSGYYQLAKFHYSSVAYSHEHYGEVAFSPSPISFSPSTAWVKFT